MTDVAQEIPPPTSPNGFKMPWVYSQSTGLMFHQPNMSYAPDAPNMCYAPKETNMSCAPGLKFKGYAGRGPGIVNNPEMEHLPMKGPIPRGEYRIGAPVDRSKKGENGLKALGSYTMSLTPVGHTAHGRTLFRIHADSKDNPGKQMASDGCIVLDAKARETIGRHPDRTLIVIE